MVKPLFSEQHDPDRRQQFDSLHDGIPDFLFPSLLDWSMTYYSRRSGKKIVADRQAILRLERRTRRELPPNTRSNPNELVRAFRSNEALFLSAIDLVLKETDHEFFEGPYPEELANFLDEAGSRYCVGTDEDGDYELQFRQSTEMTELLDTEVNQAGRAADHLRRAWSKCYRIDPDPNGACSDAVSAVEAAAKVRISPKNSRTTLSSLLREMNPDPKRQADYKWETDSEFDASHDTVLSMMRLVWNRGQYRHGDEDVPLDVSQESAEMTVEAAVLLVSWFRSGRIRMKVQTS